MRVTDSNVVKCLCAGLLLAATGPSWSQQPPPEPEPKPEPFTPMLPPGSDSNQPAAPAQQAPAQQAPPAQEVPRSRSWYSLPPKPPADTSHHSGKEPASNTGLVADMKAYVTSPLHWDRNDWAWFAAAAVAIGVSHHYDTQVRTHFTLGQTPQQIKGANTHDTKDAIPAAAVLLGTWAYASLIDDSNGRRESWDMLESAGFSVAGTYVFKYIARRDRPNDTSDPNAWEKGGGNSFPSAHSAAAFAIGTVLAESGNDEYRWIRRILGYGLGAATSYERLKHNAHWLSDTVAGSALGIATAHFIMNRHEGPGSPQAWSVTPVPGGAMLSYNLTMN